MPEIAVAAEGLVMLTTLLSITSGTARVAGIDALNVRMIRNYD